MAASRTRIVVALDLLEYSEIVLEHALDQAVRHDGPDLHFLAVVKRGAHEVEDVKKRLAALVLPALEGMPTTDWHAQLHVREGNVPEEIANLAAEVRAHLLVIGRFGLHHPRRGIGATAGRVVELAGCPTLVVGLADQSADAQAQCPACVEIRAQSEGERLFCAAHVSDRMRLSTIITPGSTTAGGGLMW